MTVLINKCNYYYRVNSEHKFLTAKFSLEISTSLENAGYGLMSVPAVKCEHLYSLAMSKKSYCRCDNSDCEVLNKPRLGVIVSAISKLVVKQISYSVKNVSLLDYALCLSTNDLTFQ